MKQKLKYYRNKIVTLNKKTEFVGKTFSWKLLQKILKCLLYVPFC